MEYKLVRIKNEKIEAVALIDKNTPCGYYQTLWLNSMKGEMGLYGGCVVRMATVVDAQRGDYACLSEMMAVKKDKPTDTYDIYVVNSGGGKKKAETISQETDEVGFFVIEEYTKEKEDMSKYLLNGLSRIAIEDMIGKEVVGFRQRDGITLMLTSDLYVYALPKDIINAKGLQKGLITDIKCVKSEGTRKITTRITFRFGINNAVINVKGDYRTCKVFRYSL